LTFRIFSSCLNNEVHGLGILCGVDIIEIDRIKKSFERSGPAFRDKVFTEKEIEYCEDKKVVKYNSYAARFAAKEAISKAFGTGISKGISWKNIEIFNNEQGMPYVTLSGGAKDFFNEIGATDISLSLSHCENYAVAYAVILTKQKTD
jgi:holo-[acyl-carrier protein] synthase